MNAASDYSLLTSRRMLQDRPPPNGGGDGMGPPPDGEGMGPPPDGEGMDGGGGGGGPEALGSSAGIAISGGYIYNALAAGNTDAVENEGNTLDVCLSHPSPFSEFHYHFWGSCLKKDMGYWSDTVSPPLCKATYGCIEATPSFTR